LVSRKSGAFRVQYDALSLEKNIEMPVTALLLEAARRSDDSARDFPETPMTMEGPESISAAFATFEDDRPKPTPLPAPPQQRHIPTVWGFAVIAVVSVAAVYGGFQAPALFDIVDDDPSNDAITSFVAKNRDRVREARAALSAVQPKLAQLEAEQATALSEGEKAKQRAIEVHKNLEVALKPELADRRFALRMADDGTEVIIEIGEGALFASDGDEVITDKKTSLARIAGALAPIDDVRIRVEGHTDDSEPPRRYRNNWAFSALRAASVASVLTAEGLSSSRVEAAAFADTKPVAPNRGKQRVRNRRIELHLSPRP
jgi:flagellar motor protein MotB